MWLLFQTCRDVNKDRFCIDTIHNTVEIFLCKKSFV